MSPCVQRVRKICKIKFFDEFSRKLSRSPPRQDARSVNNTRGSRTPRVLDFWVQVVPCLLVERSSSERASRIPPRIKIFLLWEAMLAPSWLQDRIFVRSFRKMLQSCVFSVFRWYFTGFWEVWGGIWECFGKVFP